MIAKSTNKPCEGISFHCGFHFVLLIDFAVAYLYHNLENLRSMYVGSSIISVKPARKSTLQRHIASKRIATHGADIKLASA